MKGKNVVSGAAVVAVLVGLSYVGWRVVAARSKETCQVCQRETHKVSRTVAVVNGKRATFCCPMCVFSLQQQAGSHAQFVELTDYQTGKSLAPGQAFIVRGSEINPCLQHGPHGPALDPDKQPVHLHFDRCSPSLLAFSSDSAARAFAREHGGQVLRFAEVAAQPR